MDLQRAIEGAILGGRIRRRAWGDSCDVYLQHRCIHDSNVNFRGIRYPQYHPSMGWLVECLYRTGLFGDREIYLRQFWDMSIEDVAASDWECKPLLGEWGERVF